MHKSRADKQRVKVVEHMNKDVGEGWRTKENKRVEKRFLWVRKGCIEGEETVHMDVDR